MFGRTNAGETIGGRLPMFSYTGNYILGKDALNNPCVKFLTSGTLLFTNLKNAPYGIDIFAVGAGGGGSGGTGYWGGGGGGSGYTSTVYNIQVEENVEYTVTIGAGGAGGAKNTVGKNGSASSLGSFITANGGSGGAKNADGGTGGSGGGGGVRYNDVGGAGGSNGEHGMYLSTTSKVHIGGTGQGLTTGLFGDPNGELYAGGGGGGAGATGNADTVGIGADGGANGGYGTTVPTEAAANTGGGGGGGGYNGAGGKGGSGVVIFRCTTKPLVKEIITETLLAPGIQKIEFTGMLAKEGDNLGEPYWVSSTSTFKTNGNENGVLYSKASIDLTKIRYFSIHIDTLTSWKGGVAPSFFIVSSKPVTATDANNTVTKNWTMPYGVSETGTNNNVTRVCGVQNYVGNYYIGIIIEGASALSNQTAIASGITITCTKEV